MATIVLLLLAAGGVEVSVETAAGETVTGKATLADLKVKTDYGSAVVLADRVERSEFGDRTVLDQHGVARQHLRVGSDRCDPLRGEDDGVRHAEGPVASTRGFKHSGSRHVRAVDAAMEG